MPGFNKTMTETERAICKRVRLVRVDVAKWSQPVLASELGITQNQLANLEYGRAPLRYKIGVDLCGLFDISAAWLMTGEDEIHGSAPGLWVAEFPLETNGRMLFSKVYDQNPGVFKRVVRVFGLEFDSTPGFDFKKFLLDKTDQWFNTVKFKTPAVAEKFARAVDDFALQLLQQMQRAGTGIPERTSKILSAAKLATTDASIIGKNKAQLLLDKPSLTADTVGVKTKGPEIVSLPELLQAIRARLNARGQKTALAKRLGVSRQAVDQWLSGDAKPSADLTFKLLKWVQQ